jgi:predicted Fe-Mo cluster-binding NifX family protein
MKVAIPEHEGRIAPVFDTCRRVLVVEQIGAEDRIVSNEDWSNAARHIRASRLRDLGVDALLCGGISRWLQEQIGFHGIRLFPWIAGSVTEVLLALRDGRLNDPEFAMPGRVSEGQRCCLGAKRGRNKVGGTSGKGARRCRDMIKQVL